MTDILEIATKAVQIYAETHPRPSHVTQQQACAVAFLEALRTGMRAGELCKLELGQADLIAH